MEKIIWKKVERGNGVYIDKYKYLSIYVRTPILISIQKSFYRINKQTV